MGGELTDHYDNDNDNSDERPTRRDEERGALIEIPKLFSVRE